jgi:hypothetical protein
VLIRDATPADLATLLALNNDHVPAVGELDGPTLDALVDEAAWTLVAEHAGRVAGFSLSLRQGAGYGSVNYRWFAERYEEFVYLDRIAVATEWQGRGLGARLYEELIARIGATAPVLTCEVNLRPPNEGSLRFHRRLGFREVGRQETPYGALVTLLALDLD